MLNSYVITGLTAAALLVSLCTLAVTHAHAEETPIPLSAEDILLLLKNEGVITQQQADKASNLAKDRMATQHQSPVELTAEETKDDKPALPPGVTRVPYIPAYIKDEIRDEVRLGLKEDVVDDVMAQARQESWGVPGANPDWTKKIKFNGDIRFRYQGDRFNQSNSIQYFDINAINAAGGSTAAGLDAFVNTTESRDRLRLRYRLGMSAKVTEGVTTQIRIATGNPDDPVSTNQTLGGYGARYGLALDRAYLKFNSFEEDYELYFGRMPNPWMSGSDLIWDEDLNFDGVVYKYYFNRSSSLFDDARQFDPYLTVGAFPLQEAELSRDDKWLFGTQAGFGFLQTNQNLFTIALAYYNYLNIAGVRNTPDSTLTNFTAPPYVQKGNTVFDISNSTTNPQEQLFALASDYQDVSVSVVYDMAYLAPTHIILSADYVVNIGFDKNEILQRTGTNVDDKTSGYDFGIKVGWPTLLLRGNWNASLNYRYLERDAVVDAFTDSDFHLGGTDGQGYKLTYNYAIDDSTWVQAKLISADEIDGLPLGVSTIQIDLNARF